MASVPGTPKAAGEPAAAPIRPHRRLPAGAGAAAAIACMILAISCGPAPGTGVAVLFDDAFYKLFAPYFDRLSAQTGKAASTPRASSMSLSSAAAGLSNSLDLWGRKGFAVKAVVASPLIASGYLAGAAETGIPLIVPFADEKTASFGRVYSVGYDYAAAYAALGKKAASAAKPRKIGDAPGKCCVVFQENIMRRPEALAAFTEAFSAIAGRQALSARFIGSGNDAPADLAGTIGGELDMAIAEGPRVLVIAVDDSALAEKAAKNSGGAKVYADVSSWDSGSVEASWFNGTIQADDARLAEGTLRLAAMAGEGKAPEKLLVPLAFRPTFLRRR